MSGITKTRAYSNPLPINNSNPEKEHPAIKVMHRAEKIESQIDTLDSFLESRETKNNLTEQISRSNSRINSLDADTNKLRAVEVSLHEAKVALANKEGLCDSITEQIEVNKLLRQQNISMDNIRRLNEEQIDLHAKTNPLFEEAQQVAQEAADLLRRLEATLPKAPLLVQPKEATLTEASTEVPLAGPPKNAPAAKIQFLEQLTKTFMNVDMINARVTEIEREKTPIGTSIERELNSCIEELNKNSESIKKSRQQSTESTYLITRIRGIKTDITNIKYNYFISIFQEMLQCVKNHDFNKIEKKFFSLPESIQKDFSGIHWQTCGKPTPESQEKSQRERSHDDFGRVSFLNLDPKKKCVASSEEKIKSLELYLEKLSKELKNQLSLVN